MRSTWDAARERVLKSPSATTHHKEKKKNALYWMCRDQRVRDNWAFLRAQKAALDSGGSLHAAFFLDPSPMAAPRTARHADFVLRGLREIETECRSLGVPFAVEVAPPAERVAELAKHLLATTVVCDFSPLREARADRDAIVKTLPDDVTFLEVDAHNVVPAWLASDKLEVGARTIRRKIETQLPRFLTEFPELAPQSSLCKETHNNNDWSAIEKAVAAKVDASVAPVTWCAPGETAAHEALDAFCRDGRLARYASSRNDPNANAVSDLSPYFHFGHLAPQRAALRVKAAGVEQKKTSAMITEGVKAFLEESIVRRELSDNFCLYQPRYDSLDGAWRWARDSLAAHASDAREHVYTRAQLEAATTHEDVWNAAQRQLARAGKMHGFLRMYWAKKILEWSRTPADALATALYLNDKYSIDGSDPNGYVGVAWSVCGVHDMGWKERPVFGKIRYMNYAGCKRKFNITAFCAKWPPRGKGPIDRALAAAAKRNKTTASTMSGGQETKTNKVAAAAAKAEKETGPPPAKKIKREKS